MIQTSSSKHQETRIVSRVADLEHATITMKIIYCVFVLFVGSTFGAPAVKYDQRQEGDVNIRADLENFVILIIPTSGSGSLGLLDILSKSIPGKGLLKHNKHNSHHHNQENKKPSVAPILPIQESAQHFIESKTAPYHVDISRTRSHLAKLHPQAPQLTPSEVLIAHSPTISLSKSRENSVLKHDDEESHGRSARTLHVLPNEDFQALVVSSDLFVGRKSGRTEKKNTQKNRNGENLTLLGAEMDQCGPDQHRDAQGICQLIKQ